MRMSFFTDLIISYEPYTDRFYAVGLIYVLHTQIGYR